MKKKIFGLLTACLAVMMFVQVPFTYAKNNADTIWSWGFGSFSGARYTEAREKHDDTSIYFYVERFETTNGKMRISVVDENRNQFSYTKVQEVIEPGMYCLSSYAYEDRGYGVKVRVRGDRIGQTSINANGVWSPDSYGCWE